MKKTLAFIEGGQAYKLTVSAGDTLKEHLPDICCNHEEADVRIIIYIQYIQNKLVYIKTIRIRAKDSNIFFILLYYARSFTVTILLDMGERLINMNQLAENYSQDHITALLALHVFTGQGRALWVGKVGSAYLKQNNQVPHFPSGVQLST